MLLGRVRFSVGEKIMALFVALTKERLPVPVKLPCIVKFLAAPASLRRTSPEGKAMGSASVSPRLPATWVICAGEPPLSRVNNCPAAFVVRTIRCVASVSPIFRDPTVIDAWLRTLVCEPTMLFVRLATSPCPFGKLDDQFAASFQL